jgi:uncharacterized protein YggE
MEEHKLKTRNSKTVIVASAALSLMLVLGSLFTAWLVSRTAAPAAAQTTNPPAQTIAAPSSQITVVGTGSVSAQPDILHITIGVSKQESTVKAAQSSVDGVSAAMLQALKDAGIDEKDYSTTQYTIDPVMDYNDPKNGSGVLTGYRVTIAYDVIVRDLSKVSTVIDSLTSAGANTIYGTYYTFSDANAVGKQAYSDAMNDAHERAEALASLSNLTLGRIVSVSESAGQSVPLPMKAGMGAGGGAGIVPGQQTVSTSLVVVYEATAK